MNLPTNGLSDPFCSFEDFAANVIWETGDNGFCIRYVADDNA